MFWSSFQAATRRLKTHAIAMLLIPGLILGLGQSPARAQQVKQHGAAGKLQEITDAAKPPFTFRIHVTTPDGAPQPGVNIHMNHPDKKPLVEMDVVSDAQGVAEFKVEKADLKRDRNFWFKPADAKFAGDPGVGLSPLDKENESTFIVAPSHPFQFLVQDENGRPIPDAKLWILTDHPKFPVYQAGILRAMASVWTTSAGLATARFPEVKTNIVTSARGYASNFIRGADLPKEKPFKITLEPGIKITGEVLDDQGKPLAGARVEARRDQFVMDYVDDFILKGTTNAEGRFELTGAASATTYNIQCHLDETSRPLTLDPTTVKVGGSATPESVTMQAKAGTLIKGRVLPRDKFPVAGRRIFILISSPRQIQWETQTAKDGSFQIILPPGSRGTIDFLGVAGYNTKVTVPREHNFLQSRGGSILFKQLPTGSHGGIEIKFLRLAQVGGVVRDAKGKPAEGLDIVVQPTGDTSRTQKDGSYQVGVKAGNQVILEVQDPANQNRVLVRPEPFVVAEGMQLEKDITLPREFTPAAQEPMRALIGRVVMADGKPAAGATVCLGNSGVLGPEKQSQTTWQDGSFRPAYLQADSNGEFSFNLLRPGKTDVWAWHPTGGIAWLHDVDTDTIDAQLKLHPAEKEVTIKGLVSAPDGKPAVATRVGLYAERESKMTLLAQGETDASGAFKLSACPTRAFFPHMVLLCRPREGGVAWKYLPSDSGEVALRLKPSATAAGRVADATGQPLAGATVNFYNGRDADYGSVFFSGQLKEAAPAVKTDAKGNYRITGFPVGATFSLMARHPETGRNYAWNLPIAAGDNTAPEIKLPDAVTIAGTVRYAETKQPAPGTSVTLETFSSEANPQTLTNAKGEFVLKGIEKLSYPINLTAADTATTPGWTGMATIDRIVDEGEQVRDVEILLHPTIESRQAAWRARRGGPIPGKWWAAVLTDADPEMDRTVAPDDKLTVYDAEGNVKWQAGGINTCATVSGSHALARNPADGSLWVAELAGTRALQYNAAGKLIFEQTAKKGDPTPAAFAFDGKSGNVWELLSSGTIYGSGTKVLKRDGTLATTSALAAADVAYSPKEDCFWMVGKKVTKVDREGKVLFETPEEAKWLWGAVAVSARDGAAWVTEGRHHQVIGSRDRVVIFEPDGSRRAAIELVGGRRNTVALDDARGVGWIGSALGVHKISSEGKILATVPLHATSLAVEPDTGCLWVAGSDGLYRLDPEGRPLWAREEHVNPYSPEAWRQHWLCLLPAR